MVRVTDADIARIANHLHMSAATARARFVAARGDRLVDGPAGRCPFLEDGRETRCAIYAVRPQKCRDWPYWEELIDDPRALCEAARLCPGIELSRRSLHPESDFADE
ncbi:MAG: YkgJ family cysteine cluster protein [Deltaproteobacteria bacterium]|nr:YkgJ family cysteine cluster protein [Deltaproteobacteria bacterium]